MKTINFFFGSKKRIAATILTALFILFFLIYLLPALNFLKRNKFTPTTLASILMSKDVPLKKSEGRTNFLLLGIPGGNHEGTDLTDSMIFISADLTKKDILFVSIPRDIWVDSLKDKVNTAYHYGEEKKSGGGFIMAKSAVEEITGQPVHYVLLIDFAGFKKLIDVVGGVDVTIERSFVDNKYPIPGKENDLCGGDTEYLCRFETISFEKGIKHMNGETALKFVRSRNAEGEEGTDFARGNRQQKVITAFQKKLLSLENLAPNRLSDLIQALKETIKTDLTLPEAAFLGKFGLTYKDGIRSIPLDWGNKEKNIKGFLVNPPVEKYGRWALEPRTGDFAEIHSYILCFIKDPNCKISP